MSASIPRYPSPTIGRQSELDLALAMLRTAEPPIRALTLTGPGGVGKTRLAAQIAAEWARSSDVSVYFVSLSTVNDPALLPVALSRALNIQDTGSLPVAEAVRDFLCVRRCLLVLDNVEHLTGAGPFIDYLLSTCQTLRLILTGRAPLRIAGEVDFPVPPLVLPDLNNLPSAYMLSNYAAVSLFVQRAQQADPAFALTQDNAAAIAEICVHLDGLPLAIELAAARIKAIPPQAMRERLHARLMLLVGGQRGSPRHRTMRAAIDWSYDLLSTEQRMLFARVAVFAGASAPDSLEAVCRAGSPAIPELTHVPTLLDQLAGQSLLVVQRTGTDQRYGLLETMREYALERLAERGETALLRRKHAEHFLALAQAAEPELRGPTQHLWFERFELELENVRAALAWALDTGHPELGLALVGALGWFWFVRGHLTEGRDWAEKFLTHPASAQAPAAMRAKVLLTASRLANQNDVATAEAHAREAHALAQSVNDPQLIGEALLALGRGAANRADLIATAADFYNQALQHFQKIEHTQGVADALYALGLVASDWGNYEEALSHYQQCLDLRRIEGDTTGMAQALTRMAIAAGDLCDFARSEAYGNESLELYRQLGDRGSAATITYNLAYIATLRGEYSHARTLCQEAYTIWREGGRRLRTTIALRQLAAIALAEGELDRAEALSQQAIDTARRANFKRGALYPLIVAGLAAAWGGHFERAETHLSEGLALAREVNDVVFVGLATLALGQCRLLHNDPGGEESLLESLAILHSTGEMPSKIELLEWIGIARAGRQPLQAARLWGAAEAARAATGIPLEPVRRAHFQAALAAARARAGDPAFDAALAQGRTLTQPEAFAEILKPSTTV